MEALTLLGAYIIPTSDACFTYVILFNPHNNPKK